MAQSSHLSRGQGTLIDYLAIMRLDHSTKHVFIVPGIILALMLRGVQDSSIARNVLCGFLSAICVASANYVINEWLDRESDKFHPTKSTRSAVQKSLNGRLVAVQWAILIALGISIASLSSAAMAFVCVLFGLQGVIYNVPPIRSKDVAFLDVISESINNSFRLCLGWLMIDPWTLPPGSIVAAFWFGGAFLMAAKRFSEYRQITASHGADLLVRYRASFANYSEPLLAVSCLVYAMLSVCLMTIFFMKYRIEYIILIPAIVILFGFYYFLSMKVDSSAQKPEKLFHERGLMGVVAVVSVLFLVATYWDMPQLHRFTEQHYISLDRR